jgi:hypothetical protein
MPVPWLRLLKAAIGVSTVVRQVSGRSSRATDSPSLLDRAAGPLEARLAGVVVAALREAFDRDHTRMELEREQLEREHRRAERALRLELLRQAGERELGRLRMLAGVAAASWLGTLFFSAPLAGATDGARAALAVGWLLLLGALAAAFTGQSRVTRVLGRAADRLDDETPPSEVVAPGMPGAAAPWLIVAGLAVVALGVLIA